MAKRWFGFTCPKCGGSMRTRSTGRANSGRNVVRTKECEDCGLKGVTGELWISALEGVTNIERFDEEQLFAKKERRRKKDGYWGIGSAHTKTATTISLSAGRIGGGRYNCHPECEEKTKGSRGTDGRYVSHLREETSAD
jgi:predicted RNA-binding Zn-ribbon protein involved in translation (DUF1610 family)